MHEPSVRVVRRDQLSARPTVIPRGNWHDISNVSVLDAQVLLFFSGVDSIDEIGYEPYTSHAEANPSLGHKQGSSA